MKLQRLGRVAVIIVAVIVGYLFTRVEVIDPRVDFTRYKGLSRERVSCVDPKYLNDSDCASLACNRIIFAPGLLPPSYKKYGSQTTISPASEGFAVKGSIEAEAGPAAFPTKTYACSVVNGKVTALTIDGQSISVAQK